MKPHDPPDDAPEPASAPTLPATSEERALATSDTVRGSPSSEPGGPASGAPLVDPGGALTEEAGVARYTLGKLLGEGGMGQVHLCRDRQVGREVAFKSIRDGQGSRADARLRFIREARVQGQLEHPSIVPVYEIGVAPDGAAYFTMKRVRGHTLEEIVAALHGGDEDARQRHSRRKLLAAFASVCLAVDFAHARGVLHRDLKPGNVMLGDFGEVYVLDWGLAKIAGAQTPEAPGSVDAGDVPDSGTRQGMMLATPGCLAPEPVRGDLDPLDARTDVYALGAILFELRAWEPLHPRAATNAILMSTVQGADARASVRAPDRDVPPELEAICVRATAVDPADRFPSARALCDAIERFLDGDRDLERRRALAAEHAALAADAATRAFGGGPGALEQRARAVRELGRALAFDPDHADARRTLVQLLVEPPAEPPPEALAALEAADHATRRLNTRHAAVVFPSFLTMLPLCIWMGVRDWSPLIAATVLLLAATGLSALVSRQVRPSEVLSWGVFLAINGAMACLIPAFGPLVAVPGLAASNAIAFAMEARARQRQGMVAISCLTIAVPWLLQWFGLLPASYDFRHGTFARRPWTKRAGSRRAGSMRLWRRGSKPADTAASSCPTI